MNVSTVGPTCPTGFSGTTEQQLMQGANMKVTVTEAMRLKSELAKAIVKMEHTGKDYCQIFHKPQMGEAVLQESEQMPFNTWYVKFAEMLSYSNILNNTLAKFNVTTGISELVRSKSNQEACIRHVEVALQQSVTITSASAVKLSDGTIERITVIKKPYQTKEELRHQLKQLKQSVRELLSEIDKLNTQEIELPLDKTTLEAMLSE